MRNIVSTIGSPAHGVSSYLVKIIQPTLNKNDMKITNSTSFINEIAEWEINRDEIQVSYDVIALYPSVPIEKATIIILELISKDIDDSKLEVNLHYYK